MTIRVLATTDPAFRRKFAAIRERGAQTSAAVDEGARAIVAAVRKLLEAKTVHHAAS